jgi:hypothetical protein
MQAAHTERNPAEQKKIRNLADWEKMTVIEVKNCRDHYEFDGEQPFSAAHIRKD